MKKKSPSKPRTKRAKWTLTTIKIHLGDPNDDGPSDVPAYVHPDVPGLAYHKKLYHCTKMEEVEPPKAGDSIAITHVPSRKGLGITIKGPMCARETMLKIACESSIDWTQSEKELIAEGQGEIVGELVRSVRAELDRLGKSVF